MTEYIDARARQTFDGEVMDMLTALWIVICLIVIAGFLVALLFEGCR